MVWMFTADGLHCFVEALQEKRSIAFFQRWWPAGNLP